MTYTTLTQALDNLWLLIAGFLVLLMQAGFLLLEGGRVRSKNSINVAQKNITDLALSWLCFMCLGFWVMFGVSAPMFDSAPESNAMALHFFYQLGFCGTAVTIVSGAVAERMRFRAYLVLVMVISLIIYPLAGRSVWGQLYNPDHTAWLAELGYRDFAGASLVHALGATCALVAAMKLGPRLGRFDADGNVRAISSHNSVIALLGLLFLLMGWIGFNGGLVSMTDPLLGRIVLNTLTAASFGSLIGLLIGGWLDSGRFNPARICNGMLGGLVACTAAVNVMTGWQAIALGLLGGSAAVLASELLLKRFKLDDPVDVVATHGVAGVLGTLAFALVAPIDALPAGSRLEQFAIQGLGLVIILGCASLVFWISIEAMNRVIPVRVSASDEELGLNYTEHGESVGTAALERALKQKAASSVAFDSRIELSPDDEHIELAEALNKMIDKNRQAHKLLKTSEHRFRQFAQTASDWLWETDADLNIAYISCNDKANQYSLTKECTGKPLMDVLVVSEHTRHHIKTSFDRRLPTETFEATIHLDSSATDEIVVEVRGVPNLDETGRYTGYRGTLSDISARKAAEKRAMFLSYHDELTGLPNRRALADEVVEKTCLADSGNYEVVLAGIDLDGFKNVNDTYGHHVGDILLKQVANRIESSLRPDDRVYRTGGDEFIMVLSKFTNGRSMLDGQKFCARLINTVSKPYTVEGTSIEVGASIGIASYPVHTNNPTLLPHMADLALYAAKASGKGCTVPYTPEMDLDAKRLVQMESDLREAISRQQFKLVYQPLVDTTTETLEGFEALLRWQHPERGEIQPDDFIPLAEKLGLMDEIGGYVLDEACRFASTWKLPPGARSPRISVNVSPSQFRNARFLDTVLETLEQHQLKPERLELEITEDIMIHDVDSVRDVLQTLTDLGIAVAVDDFGSGQTSLSYLSQFPISTLKIDRSFIRHLGTNSKATEITESIVNLGKKLGVMVLAEGVEEQQQLSMLQHWSCDQAQGYLFSRPVDPVTVMTMLENHGTSEDQLRTG